MIYVVCALRLLFWLKKGCCFCLGDCTLLYRAQKEAAFSSPSASADAHTSAPFPRCLARAWFESTSIFGVNIIARIRFNGDSYFNSNVVNAFCQCYVKTCHFRFCGKDWPFCARSSCSWRWFTPRPIGLLTFCRLIHAELWGLPACSISTKC